MVLPTAPPASLSVSQILTEFSITAGTQKRLSNDLFPLVGGTAGATCSLAASFSGKSSVPPVPRIPDCACRRGLCPPGNST